VLFAELVRHISNTRQPSHSTFELHSNTPDKLE
jgi:hypothetical protein